MGHAVGELRNTVHALPSGSVPPRWPLRVRQLMTQSPLTVTPDIAVDEARTLMRQHAIRHLPVLQHGHLVGIITDSDIRLVLPSPATSLAVWELKYLLSKLTVGEVMTHFVVTTAPDRLLHEAIGRMLRFKIGALPVVEKHQVVGLLTRTNILRAFRQVGAALLQSDADIEDPLLDREGIPSHV
jgi:acetoin utilization protein AcuB